MRGVTFRAGPNTQPDIISILKRRKFCIGVLLLSFASSRKDHAHSTRIPGVWLFRVRIPFNESNDGETGTNEESVHKWKLFVVPIFNVSQRLETTMNILAHFPNVFLIAVLNCSDGVNCIRRGKWKHDSSS